MGMFGDIASTIVGSGLDMVSANQQNQAAAGAAHGAQQFSAEQAQKQMDFQERMSNTAHQREVKDLTAAGLNPLLSVNSGASSPSGASASGIAPSVVPEIGPAVASAKDSMRLLQDLRESNSRVVANEARADSDKASSFLKDRQNIYTDIQSSIARRQEAMLANESDVVGRHPYAFGWLQALNNRGVSMSSASGAASRMGNTLSLFSE